MATERPILGIRARGLDPREQPHESVEAMAADYIAHVIARQPEGPYAIGGYSFGGLVAFEMARRLRAAGHEVDFLALLDSQVDDACSPPLKRAQYRTLRKIDRVTTRLPVPRARILRAARARLRAWIERHVQATVGEVPQPWKDEDMTAGMRRISQCVWTAFWSYRPWALRRTGDVLSGAGSAAGLLLPRPHLGSRLRGIAVDLRRAGGAISA